MSKKIVTLAETDVIRLMGNTEFVVTGVKDDSVTIANGNTVFTFDAPKSGLKFADKIKLKGNDLVMAGAVKREGKHNPSPAAMREAGL